MCIRDRPYVETAQKLGLPPSECFAFEDSDLGITAAVKAGCIATQIPDLRKKDAPLPDLGQYVAPNLQKAMEQIGVLAGRAAHGDE